MSLPVENKVRRSRKQPKSLDSGQLPLLDLGNAEKHSKIVGSPESTDITAYWKIGTAEYNAFCDVVKQKSGLTNHGTSLSPRTLDSRIKVLGMKLNSDGTVEQVEAFGRGCLHFCQSRQFIAGTFRLDDKLAVPLESEKELTEDVAAKEVVRFFKEQTTSKKRLIDLLLEESKFSQARVEDLAGLLSSCREIGPTELQSEVHKLLVEKARPLARFLTFIDCMDQPLSNRFVSLSDFRESTHYSKALVQNWQISRFIWERVGFAAGQRDLYFRSNETQTTSIDDSVPKGLIIVSGSTNSSKSRIAQCLALSAIRRRIFQRIYDGSIRVPHLVTYEDPIEGWNVEAMGRNIPLAPMVQKEDATKLVSAFMKISRTVLKRTNSTQAEKEQDIPSSLALGFCLTTREKKKDASSIRQVLRDALRQTPSCVYIGEVRNRNEWKEIVSFAGTGHLVIATTHSESLSEAMHRVLSASNSSSAAGRREVSSKILACLHLKKASISSDCEAVLPSMWKRSSVSVNSLVAEGLSSIVPNGGSVLGRGDFLEKCLEQWKSVRSIAESSSAMNRARSLDAKEILSE